MRPDPFAHTAHRSLIALPALLLCACGECSTSTPPPASPTVSLPAATPQLVTTTTSSGLRIEDMQLGEGDPCPAHATITINFTARLADGTVYDSTDLRKRPFTAPLTGTGLIAGLREGIPGMRRGGARILHIPYPLAYGELGRDPVPPRADLVFEIELLDFTSPQESDPREE